MSVYELLDVLASNYAKIDGLWNFFITIHLAILGALFLMPRRVSLPERGVALLAYAAFSFVNRSALIDSYDYQRTVLNEIARLKVAPDQTGGLLVQQLANFHLEEKIGFLAWSHYVAGAVVIFAFLFANTLARHPGENS
jgi:hypothetical protein